MVLASALRRSSAASVRAAKTSRQRVFPFFNQTYKVRASQKHFQKAAHSNHRHTKGGTLFWRIASGVTVLYTVPSTIALVTLQLFNKNG